MLYALVLFTIFGMLLSFFLETQIEGAKNAQAQKDYMTAQLMMSMGKKALEGKEEGTVKFDRGILIETREETRVRLEDGKFFSFQK